jgi:cytochrome c
MIQSDSLKMLGVLALFTLPVLIDFGLRGTHRFPESTVWQIQDGDFLRGKAAIIEYGCGSCHVIPGVREAKGRVGPQLSRLREQIYLAGVLPNIPENLIEWIQHPRDINPQTAMPNLGVTEEDARDMATYLYSVFD